MESYKKNDFVLDDKTLEKQLHESLKKIPWEMKKVKLYLSLLKRINIIKNFFSFK